MKRDWWDREFKWLFTLGESTTAGGWSGGAWGALGASTRAVSTGLSVDGGCRSQ